MSRPCLSLCAALLLCGCKPAGKPIAQPQAVPTPAQAHTKASPPSTGILATQAERWSKAIVLKEKTHFVTATAEQIRRNRPRYETVSAKTGVPWPVIACIHNMECGLSFKLGLYCGDPLTARTRNEPKGMPKAGAPPFQWEAVAVDALQYDRLDREAWNAIAQTLQNIEAYNGTGYQKYHPETPTPYLWSWTNVYTRGKYVADGKWSPTAVSAQCGVVPILKVLGFE